MGKNYTLPANREGYRKMDEAARIITRAILDGKYKSFQNQTLPRRKPHDVVVHPHSWKALSNAPATLGLIERWTYEDRPDLGVFGDRFIPVEHAGNYI